MEVTKLKAFADDKLNVAKMMSFLRDRTENTKEKKNADYQHFLLSPQCFPKPSSLGALTLPKQALVFMCLQYKSFENTVGKGEIARNEQFVLFPKCFLSVWRSFCHFHQIQNCRLRTL